MGIAIAIWVVLLAIFYVLVVRPQRRRVLEHRVLMSSLTTGDDVLTAGGIHGTIRALDDEIVDLEIAPGVVIKLSRGAIARRTADDVATPELGNGSGDGEVA
jgi:preprotein translocase subunit YajC